MADPTQFSFELREIAELLVKHQRLHEGRWAIGFEFGLGAGFAGPTSSEAKPAAFIQINKLLLSRPADDMPADSPFVVDAAEVNPRTKPTSNKPRKGLE